MDDKPAIKILDHKTPAPGPAVEEKFIFTITCIKAGKDRNRCWGWYEKFEDAEEVVLANATDMFEDNYYDYAVIEKCPQGILAHCVETWWYHAKYDDRTPDTVLREPVSITKVTTPDWAYGVINFGIG